MYTDGLRSLIHGWTKKTAKGASIVPKALLWMVFTWVASLISVSLHMVIFAINNAWTWLNFCSLLYIAWAIILYLLSLKVGKFHVSAILLHALLTIGFLMIFGLSLFRKLFDLSVTWKGRTIRLEEKP